MSRGADLLGRWLAANNVSAAAFGSALGLHEAHVLGWLGVGFEPTHFTPPSLAHALLVEAVTYRCVPALSWSDPGERVQIVAKARAQLGIAGRLDLGYLGRMCAACSERRCERVDDPHCEWCIIDQMGGYG